MRSKKKRRVDDGLSSSSSAAVEEDSSSSSSLGYSDEFMRDNRCSICGKIGSKQNPLDTSVTTSAGTYVDAIHEGCRPERVHLAELKSDLKTINNAEWTGALAKRLLKDNDSSLLWPYKDVLIDDQRRADVDCEDDDIYEMDPFVVDNVSSAQMDSRAFRMVVPQDAHVASLARVFPNDRVQGDVRSALEELVKTKWAQMMADQPLDQLTQRLIGEDLARKLVQVLSDLPPAHEETPLTGDSLRDLLVVGRFHGVSAAEAHQQLRWLPASQQQRERLLLDAWRRKRQRQVLPYDDGMTRYPCANCGKLMNRGRQQGQSCSRQCAEDLCDADANRHLKKDAIKLFKKRSIV